MGSLSTLSTPVIPSRVSVSFVPVDGTATLPLLVNGEPEKVDEHRAKEILTQDDLQIQVDLGLGDQSTKFWTCDFSHVCHTILARLKLSNHASMYRNMSE